MSHEVVFSADAEAHLVAIYDYVEAQSSPAVADRFTADIADFCLRLALFPERGAVRPELGPGLRVIGFRNRVAIAFEVAAHEVIVVGIYYGGVDYGAKLAPPDSDES